MNLSTEQEKALDRMADDACGNVFIAWWKMGTGKTRLALAAFERSEFQHLIVVTRRVAFLDWVQEMENCGLNYNVFQNTYEICNLLKMGKGKRTVILLSAGDLKSTPVNLPVGQMLVVDELYLFANPQAKRTKFMRDLSFLCRARIGLSGTIMPARDNISIFGQLYALSAHYALARNATEFRTLYQNKGKGRFGKVYLNKDGSDKVIAAKLSSFVDLNFPEGRPTQRQILHIEKTKEQDKAITSLRDLYEFNNRTYDYTLQILNVINGISNGWFLDNGDNLLYYKSDKVTRLLALLDDLVSSGERVVVWCAYHNDITRISQDLKEPWLEFTGRVPFDHKEWEKGEIKIVLATEANGASVNHFKHVKYAIYFSINYKALDLQQSMTRHERTGSSHDGAFYYFLQVRGTVDARIYYLVNESTLTEKELVQQLYFETFCQ